MARSTSGMYKVSVAGIPCYADVTSFTSVGPWTGSAHNCPSDWDYYGYTEIAFELYDRKGYPAAWLEKKMDATLGERERIEQQLIEEKRRGN